MTVQRLHPNLAAVDILTGQELHTAMGHQNDALIRDWYRGIKVMRIPLIRVVATGVLSTIAPQLPGAQAGPESGFIWRVFRVTISSSGADVGNITLYVGSDPANIDGAHQVDNTLKVGQAYRPGREFVFPDEFLFASAATVAGNTYTMTGVVAQAPAEMAGKII
jgi:hypothetical protein